MNIFHGIDLIKQIFEQHPAESLLVVSNRTSVLEKTDFTIVLDEGQIEAIGTHEELIKTSAFYRDTWQLQK